MIFYNGTQEQPDQIEMRLSDAFLTPVDRPALELTATMYNINMGRNRKLMGSCRVLWEYAEYVRRVRAYADRMPIGQAVERAITECIREGILSDFLRRNRAEAMNMSIYEYDEERLKEAFRQDGYDNGYDNGYDKGWDAGNRSGEERGEKKGSAASKVEDILELLRMKGEVPGDLEEELLRETELDILRDYFRLAARVGSVDEFMAGYAKKD